jgi:TDG/mug DNA glycosylase family protein
MTASAAWAPIMGSLETHSFPTLPDYLAPGLDLVFVGINPGLYSVRRGHYFARPTNRFWPAFSRSRLSAPIRAALGRTALSPEDDALLLAFGIGFTDVVKVPSSNAASLRSADFAAWAPQLQARLLQYRPRVACFHGLTAFRAFVRYALGLPMEGAALGPQPHWIGETALYVVPNPSPANAHFRLGELVAWYDRLAQFLEETKGR